MTLNPRSNAAPTPSDDEIDRNSNWSTSVDADLATALALARASTQALLNLSPLAHREISQALALEVSELERRGGERDLSAAEAIRPMIPKAA
jgi:hypothetical protein